MLTLKQIIDSAYHRVPASPDGTDRFDRAKDVKVYAFKQGVKKSSGAHVFLAKTLTQFRIKGKLSREMHVSSVEFPIKGVPESKQGTYVKLSCSCADFCMRWEYNLAKRGAAEIIYGNGEAPTTRIPVGLCMHLISMTNYLAANHYINRDFTLKR